MAEICCKYILEDCFKKQIKTKDRWYRTATFRAL